MATPAADSGGARGIYRALWLCAALLILATAAWLYWPGIDGPALLDDKSSLGRLEQLVEQPDYLSELVAGERSGPLGRPLSVWSFALEKIYLGGASPTTKTINVLLHVFNGALVMYFCLLLLRAAGIPAYRSLAVIAGAAWLVSPLYISTVLYMVQRMAMLAATLVLLSCIGYLRWRVALSRGEWAWSWLLAALVFGLAAPFAKENGVLVLPLVICIELFWFGFRGEGGQVIGWLKHGTLASLTAMILLPLLFLVLNPGYFEAQFRSRDFTLWERLLTQSRVVWDYVAQHIWPEVARKIEQCNIRNYSIFHRDGLLFAYFEYVGTDFEADMEAMAADPRTQEWWDMVKPMQKPVENLRPGEWWADMEEVFHQD